MQLSLKFVLGLMAASTLVTAAEPVTVNLQRRKSLFKAGGVLDLKSFDFEVKLMTKKYKSSLDNYKRNTGQEHPLLSLIHI